MNKKAKIFLTLSVILSLTIIIISITNKFKAKENKQYSNKDFNIEPYISTIDKDNDGIDDQTDILNNVKKYIETKPKYKSKYYSTGYPNDAGYDLMELVNQDILKNQKQYNIKEIDKNIDFRRVNNLDIYLKNNHITLTTDLSKIEEWQGGDIIVFKDHIGIISDKRNKNGIPFLIHHANPIQKNYEENILEIYGQDFIIGHYRIS